MSTASIGLMDRQGDKGSDSTPELGPFWLSGLFYSITSRMSGRREGGSRPVV